MKNSIIMTTAQETHFKKMSLLTALAWSILLLDLSHRLTDGQN